MACFDMPKDDVQTNCRLGFAFNFHLIWLINCSISSPWMQWTRESCCGMVMSTCLCIKDKTMNSSRIHRSVIGSHFTFTGSPSVQAPSRPPVVAFGLDYAAWSSAWQQRSRLWSVYVVAHKLQTKTFTAWACI